MFQTKLCMHHKTPATDVYRSLGELGRGAFGVVEKVEHLKTHRQYAMKTVRFESGSKRHEFEKEMGILRVLHHPNIHRDLKLENILVETLDNGGRIKLCEYDIATFWSMSCMRKVLGSVVYMAGNYKETCDMWSLVSSCIFAGEVSYTGKVWDMISPERKRCSVKLLHITTRRSLHRCTSASTSMDQVDGTSDSS
ncbi:Protein kinase, ATP binding site [Phytophthora cactorum]|nr:Protein kinase, ATP binding site [Phytophthora cactorum]